MPHAPDLSGLALDGRYELHVVIGEGTFGRVYRGVDRRLARSVAVKVIKPWWAEDPEWVKTFEREAQLLASVSDPGIVQIFDAGSAPEGLYYVAELVEGESLAARLRRRRLSAAEACDVAEQLARALSTAHARRVVHRDVKPANVLISRDGRIKVGDFGVAHLAEGSSDGAAGTIAGTPKYMAPEQARGEATTPATDVYGVGIVLYEMLAGHAPFEGNSPVELAMRHVHDAPPSLPPGTPHALVQVVGRALAKDPFDRYANGAALADALGRASLRLSDEDDDLPELGSSGGGGVATLARPTRTTIRTRTRTVRMPRAQAAPRPAAAASGVTQKDPSPKGRFEKHPSPKGRFERDASPKGRFEKDASPKGRFDPTVLGEPMSRRSNINPSARRRTIALVGFVVVLAGGMLTGALALAPGRLRVPNVHGMTRARIVRQARRMDYVAAFSSRWSGARKGTAIAQSPKPGFRVKDGTTVDVVLSSGPKPVSVPRLEQRSLAGAQAALSRLRLRWSTAQVPAPGVTPGTVVGQSPRPGSRRTPGSTIALSVAEKPQLRALTSFSGDGDGRSVVFQVRGTAWNLITGMGYEGNCTFILVCSGPSATVTDIRTGKTVDQFGLDENPKAVRTVKSGPGLYQVTVSPGSDTARWSVKVDDYY